MKNEIAFLNWVFENHYFLANVEDGIYYYQNQYGTYTADELFSVYQNLK